MIPDPNSHPLSFLEEGIQRPSVIEWVGRFVPICGWYVAYWLEKNRLVPHVEFVKYQLSERRPPDWFSREDVEATFARQLAHEIKTAFDWPNDYFLPSDPAVVLFLNDDGRGVEVWQFVDDFIFPQTISQSELDQLVDKTFWQLVQYILRKRGSQFGGAD